MIENIALRRALLTLASLMCLSCSSIPAVDVTDEDAMVALEDLGDAEEVEFSRLIIIPFEISEGENSEPSSMDLIHQVDP